MTPNAIIDLLVIVSAVLQASLALSTDSTQSQDRRNNVTMTSQYLLVSDPPVTTTEAPVTPVAVFRNHSKASLLPLDECGVSSVDLIVHGNRAAREQFPWMARLCYVDESEYQICGCGATVISKRYLLTAAHCVVSASWTWSTLPTSAVLGEHDDTTDPDCDSPEVCSPLVQTIGVQSAVAHPNYEPNMVVNDIALVLLEKEVDFSTGAVTPICLPLGDLQFKNYETVPKLFVAGWGLTENGSASSVLLYTGVPPVPNSACARAYDEEPVGIVPSVMCAGGAPQDSCSGDSGGPLMMLDTVRFADGEASTRVVQAGIVSYGPEVCGLPGVPAVYTRVGFHLEWILSTMEP